MIYASPLPLPLKATVSQSNAVVPIIGCHTTVQYTVEYFAPKQHIRFNCSVSVVMCVLGADALKSVLTTAVAKQCITCLINKAVICTFRFLSL